MKGNNQRDLWKSVNEKEEAKLTLFLNREYGFNLFPETIKKYSGKTASSQLYRYQSKRTGLILIKKSFWYDDQATQKSLGALQKAYEVSEVLRSHGLPLPKVFFTKDKRLVSTLDLSPIVVLEYKEGLTLSFTEREFISSATALATFHREGRKYLQEHPEEKQKILEAIPIEKPYEESRKIYFDRLRDDLLKTHHCDFSQVCQTVKENIGLIDKTIELIDSSGVTDQSLSSGVLHNDFNTGNCLFGKDGTLLAILDIDQVGIGPYIWDIANTLSSFGWKAREFDLNFDFEEFTKIFIQAYHKEFPLPLSEYELCLAARQRWDVMRILRSLRRHHYENNRLPELLPKIKNRFIPRLILAPELFSFLTKSWLKSNPILPRLT
jgi:Ser/Thr protein kinase RdoA (MazF antagonist)